MLQPELWREAQGFFDSLFRYPKIWQRYFHFMAASFAVMGMYMYWLGSRKQRGSDDPVYALAKQFGKGSAFWFTLLQIFAGPFLLFSMNSAVRDSFLGGSAVHTSLLAAAVLLAIVLLVMLLRLLKFETRRLFLSSLAMLLLIIGLMSWIRHEVRELYLAPYMEELPRTVQKGK